MTAEDKDKKAGEAAPVTACQLYREAQDHAASQNDYDVQAGLDRFTAWMQDKVAGSAAQAAPDPPPADARRASVPQPPSAPPQPESGLPGMAAAIAAADPAVRMALRRHPVILAVILSDILIRALAIADEADVDRARTLAINHDLDRALKLARVLDLDLDRARDLNLDIDLNLARVLDVDLFLTPRYALNLDPDYDLTLRRALNLASAIDRARGLALDLNDELAVAIDHAIDRARARTTGGAVDRDLGRAWRILLSLGNAVDHASHFALDPDHELDRYLDRHNPSSYRRRYRNRARNPGLDRARDLRLALAHNRQSALWRAIALLRDLELDRARYLDHTRDLAHRVALVVGAALGVRQVEGLAAVLLDGALDDFTHADLGHVDLVGIDLTGVRWSASGTEWPEGTDVDALRARSREDTPGSGIYVITSPGPGSNIPHDAPV